MSAPPRRISLLALAAAILAAADFRPPAGNLPAVSRPGATSILPGGRAIVPVGVHVPTGPGAFGIALSPSGKMVVTANGGPRRYSLTVAQRTEEGWRRRNLIAGEAEPGDEQPEDGDWRSVFQGLAFAGENDLWSSEGNSGRVRLLDPRTGRRKAIVDLNAGEYADSYSGDMVLDAARQLLYVVDQANFRVAIIDAARKRLVSSVRVGRLPFAIALEPGGRRVWVTNIGMFEYKAIPGADAKKLRETALPFPAFGFPSRDSAEGVRSAAGSGSEVEVPALGDPNRSEANSVSVVNVEDPASPRVERHIRTGTPFGGAAHGGSSPSGITIHEGRAYVANGHNDSITVIDTARLERVRDVELRIPRLETLRGVLPIGLLVEPSTGWLLVAEAGINALGVIDTKTLTLLGHIPTPWFPTRAAVRDGAVYLASAKGHGTGPNAERYSGAGSGFRGRRGSISVFALPAADELPKLTERVYAANGFVSQPGPAAIPTAIEYAVIILKENRTFDEVFGDVEQASNGPVAGLPPLARFGERGVVVQARGELKQRLNLRNVNVTPNHHEIARRWAFSDNFYADSEVNVDGHHWIAGSYPNAWTESTLMAASGGNKDFRLPTTAPGRLLFAQGNASIHPEEQLEAGALWHHLERHNVPFRNFGEGFELAGSQEGPGLKPTGARFLTNVPMPDPLFRNTSRAYPGYNTNIPDQYRATQFIHEIERLYAKPGKDLPRLLFLHLPNDHIAKPRPEDGYPFPASFVADNDYALGRIVEYLSNSKWWPKMAIFITEDDAQGGVDHIESHRTILLVASPYAKKNYVSHVNASFPALLKTVFRILRLPPLNLYDAAAADLSDCFQAQPDFSPYQVRPIRPELFEPDKAREPLDPTPVPRMDDPAVLREQQRQ